MPSVGFSVVRYWLFLCALIIPVRLSYAAEPLKVGMTTRSMPCTFYSDGHWQGSFFENWNEIAIQASVPYQLIELPNFRQLLEAGQAGQIDIAVGCVNMTPERLAKYRFSVPIQEDGISVLVRKEQSQTWLPVLKTLWSGELLGLLASILAIILLATLVLWRVERYGKQESTSTTGRPRTFIKLFQILLTGPGTNTIASTVRGNSLISVVYFIRIIAASILVSFVSVNIIKKATQEAASGVRAIGDLAGKKVSVGTGSVSEHWVEGYNAGVGASEPERRIQIQQIE